LSLEQGKIDLHGLHVTEAKDCFLELLPIFQKYNLKKLYLITGTGHHTKGPQAGKARLLPYIKELCEIELGLKVQEVKDVSGYSGALIVDISSISSTSRLCY
jgi:DNA-nicking Smr family endonuclease